MGTEHDHLISDHRIDPLDLGQDIVAVGVFLLKTRLHLDRQFHREIHIEHPNDHVVMLCGHADVGGIVITPVPSQDENGPVHSPARLQNRADRLTGKEAAKTLHKAGITVNKNTVPFDTQSPFVTSGIRVGTPALTTRGMKEPEMDEVGAMMAEVLDDLENADIIESVKGKVADLTKRFPLYE